MENQNIKSVIADRVEVKMVYHPAFDVFWPQSISVHIKKRLKTRDVSCELFVDGKERYVYIEQHKSILRVINKANVEELLAGASVNNDLVQLDGGSVDYMVKMNGKTKRKKGLEECCLPDNKMLNALLRWCKRILANEPVHDLLNALTALDVVGVKTLLGMHRYNAKKNDNIITIPIAWEWLIGPRDSWTDKEEGNDFYDRNQAIKEVLHERLGIDWDNVAEECMPDAIVRRSMMDEADDPIEDFFEMEIDYMREHYDEKDILLYYYVHRVEIAKVEALLAQGANPHSIIDGGDDAEMYAVWHSEGGLNDLVHVVKGEYDKSMTYTTSEDDVYVTCAWTLIRGAAYARLIALLE